MRIASFRFAMSRPLPTIAAPFLALTLLICGATATTAADDCHRALTFAEPAITSSVIPSAVYGDFNEDGRPDVAAMLEYDTRIVALNRGGVFEPKPAEVQLRSLSEFPVIAATDVNRDGHLDLIYRRYNLIQVALGWGDGAFKPPVASLLPRNNVGLWRLLDFNHDGLLDFVDFDFAAGGFTFVQSKGDGTFEEVAHVDLTGGQLQGISTTAGDFDGDGNIDVLRLASDLPSFSTVATFGWSDGKFHFVQTGTSVDVPSTLQPVDLDGDGAEEMVGIKDGSLIIMRARTRKVTVERIPVAPNGVTQVMKNPTMLDANGDGIRDLVFSSGNSIGVIWGTGGNHFGNASYFELPGAGNFAAIDIDHDGVPDIAATSGRQGLPVLYGAALRAGNANRVYPVGFTPAALAFADVDGDGIRDLVVTSDNGTDPLKATVLFGDGKGGFPRVAKSLVMPGDYTGSKGFVSDFDSDGHADLAITTTGSFGNTKPIVAFGTADGFPSATLQIDADRLLGTFSRSSSAPGLVALKGDDVQLITISSGRTVTASTVYRRPTGSTVLAIRSDANAPIQIAVVTADGVRLITETPGTWKESVLAAGQSYAGTSTIMAADLDGDGRTDYALTGEINWLLFARSDGSFRAQGIPTLSHIDSITAADFDGDGIPTLVVTERGNFGDPGSAQVLRNVEGTFQPQAAAITGAPFRDGAIVADVDSDGRPEVLIPSFDGVEILNNICAQPRIHVAAVLPDPVEGGSVTLVIHPILISPYPSGSITISEGGKVLATPQVKYPTGDFATAMWTSPRLTAGTHTFTIRHDDPYSGSSSIDFVVTTKSAIPRQHSVRR